jgi:hypothetical protein
MKLKILKRENELVGDIETLKRNSWRRVGREDKGKNGNFENLIITDSTLYKIKI